METESVQLPQSTSVRPLIQMLLIAALMGLALRLRTLVDVPLGVLDIDTINFGLSAFRFSLTEHQPHPPGYIGYVLYLKLIHLAAPGLGPVEVAKWGCRLASIAAIPAAWWTCQEILKHRGLGARASAGQVPREVLLPLVAALLVVLEPLLWYYGGDGQSHGAEATFSLLLVGASLACARRTSLAPRLALVVAFGLVGSLRPTIPLTASPLLIYVFWRRPLSWWLAALGVGVASVALWMVPLVVASGGWDVYQRTSKALIQELYVETYSPFGSRNDAVWTRFNLSMTWTGALLAALPLLAWVRTSRPEPWRAALWSVVGANLLFYHLLFTGDLGYFTQVAAVACLVPATWPEGLSPLQRLRAGVAVLLCPAVMFLAPPFFHMPGSQVPLMLPVIQRVFVDDVAQETWTRRVCGWTSRGPSLLLTDNYVVTHSRMAPLRCPGVVVGLRLDQPVFNPVLDNWIFYFEDGQTSLPTGIPLEAGDPTRWRLPTPVATVLVTPDSSRRFKQQVSAVATCPPLAGAHGAGGAGAPDETLVWPVSCLPTLPLGRSLVELSAYSAPE